MSAANSKTRARRRTAKEHGPDPIDVHVGQRVRLARELAGLTQTEIGKQLRMSFQVVQKYEQGDIRVSASRLFQLTRFLKQPIGYFFAALDGRAAPPADGNAVDPREIELVQAYRRIGKRVVRQRLLQLVRGASKQSDERDGPEPEPGTTP